MIFTIIFRTILFYFVVAISYKIMGKRELGELGVFDFIISMLISQLVAICIENYKDSILFTLVPIIILVLFQIIFAKATIKSDKFKQILDGKESVIINKGKLNFNEMVKQRYSLNDLLLQLRDKSISTIEDVEYAILETNGKLSVFEKKKSKNVFPLPLVIDGVIKEDNLKLIKRSTRWLKNALNNKNVLLKDVFYAFYKDSEIYIIKKELK